MMIVAKSGSSSAVWDGIEQVGLLKECWACLDSVLAHRGELSIFRCQRLLLILLVGFIERNTFRKHIAHPFRNDQVARRNNNTGNIECRYAVTMCSAWSGSAPIPVLMQNSPAARVPVLCACSACSHNVPLMTWSTHHPNRLSLDGSGPWMKRARDLDVFTWFGKASRIWPLRIVPVKPIGSEIHLLHP